MPSKVRDLNARVGREGLVDLPKRSQGRHERWKYPLLEKTLTIWKPQGRIGIHEPIQYDNLTI